MPTLRDVQEGFRRNVLDPADDAIADLVVADGIAATDRLRVYRNTFASTLIEALRLTYPIVDRLVGAEFFDGAALEFARRRPPDGAYLNDYGGTFAEFLAEFPPAALLAYLTDVARLEWAVSSVINAPDVAPLDIARLAAIAPRDQARIAFIPHPAARLLRLDRPADAIWRAVLERDDRALAALDVRPAPAPLLVSRDAEGVAIRRLDEPAWRFAADLWSGHPLGKALRQVCPSEASHWLADHLARGHFAAFRLCASDEYPAEEPRCAT